MAQFFKASPVVAGTSHLVILTSPSQAYKFDHCRREAEKLLAFISLSLSPSAPIDSRVGRMSNQTPKVHAVKDFDWTAKLVNACDSSLENLQPLLQLLLHCENEQQPLRFEFTPVELETLIAKIEEIEKSSK
uniref:COMM domain-containing protein n=1 Tax=Steinernema glaseri TaxID=37863 RepID=A0A1I8AJN6_9BILA